MRRRDLVRTALALIAAACGAPAAPPQPTRRSATTAVAAPAPTPAPEPRPTSSAVATPFDPRAAELIDAHAHYVPEIVPALRSVGVRPTAFFSSGPSITGQLVGAARANPGAQAWVPAPIQSGATALPDSSLAFVRQQLPTGNWRGIGEVTLRHGPLRTAVPVDSPAVLELFGIAANQRVPVNVHVDGTYADEFDRALAKSRNTLVIWAHVGSTAEVSVVRDMFRKHPRLYADVSSRGEPFARRLHIFDADGALKPEWKSLLEEIPDRFLFGTDIGPAPAPGDPVLGPDPSNIATTVSRYRSLLAQLTPATAERIAVVNARQILGI